MKVTLYGHLMADRIFEGFKEHSALGGIANVWVALKHLNPNLEINLQPTHIGEALILVDKENNSRVSKCHYNLKSRAPVVSVSDWHHIAYINRLDPFFLKRIYKGIVSADVTKENPEEILSVIDKIDYLFISIEDLFTDITSLGALTRKGVIAHSPKECWFAGHDGRFWNCDVPPFLILKNVNVLGAGDYFAASVINSMLNGTEISQAITKANKDVTTLLQVL